MDFPTTCERCLQEGALCDYHAREELAGFRLANRELHKRIRELEKTIGDGECSWREESQGEYWETSCEQAHAFTAGGPRENFHRFCPYCGGKLKVEGE